MEQIIDELAKKRALKFNDSTSWKARDALLDLVKQIDEGLDVSHIAIHFYERLPEDRRRHHFQCAGITYEGHLMLLEIAKRRLVEDYLDG